MLVRMWRNRKPYTLLVGRKINTSWKISIEVTQDTKNRTNIWPGNLLLGVCPKEMKLAHHEDICIPKIVAKLVIIAKTWKKPYQLTGKENWYYIIYKSWNIIQIQKDKCCLISLISGILKNQTHKGWVELRIADQG